ncbi:glycosyltransferase [Methylobacterium sp. BTF04]|nr:glycosyltransferase [Methylobacterium sp. BTF04]
MSDDALSNHFIQNGRVEGRFPRADDLICALEAEHGPLPSDFLPEAYRASHADLESKLHPWELKEHYLRYGRYEKRKYRSDFSIFEDEFFKLKIERADRSSERDFEQKFASFWEMLETVGVAPSLWLNRFMPFEFALLNAHWLPRMPSSRIDGICLFLSEGIDRIAPIALAERFEPDFFRMRRPDILSEATDAELYREWLSRGMIQGHPGSEAQALRRLIGEDRFPSCFDEVAYRAQVLRRINMPAPGRFAALEHFIAGGFDRRDIEIGTGSDTVHLLEQIGEHHLSRGNATLATKAFDRAISLKPGVGRLHHRRGDTLCMLNRQREAQADFLIAAGKPGSSVWSHIHAAEGLAAEPERADEALTWFLRGAPRFCSLSPWRAAGHSLAAHVFEQAVAHARTLYIEGLRSEADDHVTAMLARIGEAIQIFDPLPSALPPPKTGTVVIVANRDLPQCDHYRVEQKRRQLEYGGWDVEIFTQSQSDLYRSAIDHASVVIFYRVAASPAVLHAILYARALGIPTVYEIDDLLFDPAHYPDPFESFEEAITKQEYIDLQNGVPLFRYALQQCDMGLASTPALAEAMQPLVRSGICHVLRNGLDQRNVPFLAARPAVLTPSHVTIFYGSGTKAHNRDFTELAGPALLEILDRYPQVRLVIAGYLNLDGAFRPFANRVRQLGFTANVEAYWEVLSAIDINLAVLASTPMSDAKSEIKWLEAAMCGVASIVSATRTYREVLTNGEDALLVTTPEEWVRALDSLVRNPLLRRRIGARARARALEVYGLDEAVSTLRDILPAPRNRAEAEVANWMAPRGLAHGTSLTTYLPLQIVPSGRLSSPQGGTLDQGVQNRGRSHAPGNGSKPRVLLVNVYFPPQTLGGATHVLRDNVDHFLDHAGDRFEFAVAAIDADGEVPYRTRVDGYRGVPVYRIGAPRERNMIWRPFNPMMRAPFEELLDRFEPDLVHFHCVQRLTATVVEAVRARGLPYFVTLHDAWWISDFQFLVDEIGQVHSPSPDPIADAIDPALNPVESIGRRFSLARLLNGADALLAVSETFKELYRQAGHPETRAVPNGVPVLPVVARRPSKTGRVRLGQIGGRTTHKGATLIESVLRANDFRNLTLTIVDHACNADYEGMETWGTTPVRIIGFVPHEEIANVYADLDVLLAPSIWPESFGLVTREARAAGLWVVASDRGAIGESIREDVDGFRIDVSSPAGLLDVLKQIDARPARFHESPPLSHEPERATADQANDLLALYDELLTATSPLANLAEGVG